MSSVNRWWKYLNSPAIQPLSYAPEHMPELYARLHGQGPSFFLHSSLPGTSNSRYSYMGCFPRTLLMSKGPRVTVIEDGKTSVFDADPFDEVQKRQRARATAGLPFFSGGAVGYWGYDLKDRLERLPSMAATNDLPDAAWMFVDAVVVADFEKRTTFLSGTPDGMAQLAAALKTEPVRPQRPSFRYTISPALSRQEYLDRVERIRRHIAAGDVYEVNLTQRFDVTVDTDSPAPDLDIFLSLATVSPSPFSALLNFGQFSVISSSPERFLRVNGRLAESRPIKGTRPRRYDFHDDESSYFDLLRSEKDRAENVMIVDLVRNDLGRVAKTGTVNVPELCAIEPYATVFQMVSTITAEIESAHSTMDAVKACFPPGSMTGAPKIRAMEIIESLEPSKRGVYSGALGYMGYDGNCDLSVIIRTLILEGRSGYFQTGGAIVWDSDAEKEYQECLDKAEGIRKALERIEN